MSWLRRLSRDRSSKGEQDYREMPPSFRPSSSYANNPHNVAFKDTQYPSTHTSQDMLQSYRRADPQEQNYAPPQRQLTSSDGTMHTAPSNLASAPDPLTRAFNEAIKPYVEQIDMLKTQIDDLSIQNQQLEGERTEMHAWIDKRGLRPDLPRSLASALPTDSTAAANLSHQLDRKMTMLNYDLHRLADSLPTPLPASTVAQPLSTLLPSIMHLSTLRGGPSQAFELLIKLGGNMNSHAAVDELDDESRKSDAKCRADFYGRLDGDMVEIIQRRMEQGNAGEEQPSWQISRDVKRLEKTSEFLRREMALHNYFTKSLEVLRYEMKKSEGVTRYPHSP